MPKIISVNKDSIIQVTKDLLNKKEYSKINCRDIARISGIGVGTLYHFFKCKNDILALIILDDWIECINKMDTNTSIYDGIMNIYNSLYQFILKYKDFWDYTRSNSTDYVSYLAKHSDIIDKIKEKIISLYDFNNKKKDDSVIINFLAEIILSYSSRLIDYSQMEPIFFRIIGGNNNE